MDFSVITDGVAVEFGPVALGLIAVGVGLMGVRVVRAGIGFVLDVVDGFNGGQKASQRAADKYHRDTWG